MLQVKNNVQKYSITSYQQRRRLFWNQRHIWNLLYSVIRSDLYVIALVLQEHDKEIYLLLFISVFFNSVICIFSDDIQIHWILLIQFPHLLLLKDSWFLSTPRMIHWNPVKIISHANLSDALLQSYIDIVSVRSFNSLVSLCLQYLSISCILSILPRTNNK